MARSDGHYTGVATTQRTTAAWFPSLATLLYLVSAPRGEAARQRILDATRQLVHDGGLEAFNVEAVAAASGSARTTIYRHWPEPRDLLIDTLQSMAQDLPKPDTGSLHGDLQAYAGILRSLFDDPRARRLILDVTRAAAADPDMERIRQQLIRDRHQPMQLILQRALARGEIDPDLDLGLALHLVEGPLISATVIQNQPISDEEIETVVSRIVQALS